MEQNKSRYWAFLMYEDSRPKNWKEIMEDWMIPICISPYHDRDIKDDGTLKEPHYHVLICFEGPTTYKNAMNYASQINAKIVKKIASVKGAYDYWIHKNNPEKAQYDEDKMILLNGFNIKNLPKTDNEIEELKIQIIDTINNEDITEYKVAYDYFKEKGMIECCQIISTKTIFFNAYIKSRKFMIEEKKKVLYNGNS